MRQCPTMEAAMAVDRHDDYWTQNEKLERETGTSLVAGGIFVVLIAVIALAFAVFGSSHAPETASSPPAVNSAASTR
jgi:hypothetical protein